MSGSQLPGLQLYNGVHASRAILNPATFPLNHFHYNEPSKCNPVQSFESHTRIGAAPGKGSGLFAIKDIPAYSLILSDYALVGLFGSENLLELLTKYKALPEEHRVEFDTLSKFSNAERDASLAQKLRQRSYTDAEVGRMVEVSQRFLANAFNVSDEDAAAELKLRPGQLPLRRAIFGRIARINHSCVPNAHAHYEPGSKSQVLYSLRSLEAGEEIVISYFDITLPRDQRQVKAKTWGFNCMCQACQGEGAKAHEEKLAFIRDAMTLGAHVASEPDPKSGHSTTAILKKVIEAVAIAEISDGLLPTVPLL